MTPPLKRIVHVFKVRPRLFVVIAIGVLTGLFLPQGIASQPISRWLVAWNVGAWLYVALAQFPVYLLPLPFKPLVRWLTQRTN